MQEYTPALGKAEFTSDWAGQFLFGESWACYRGVSAHNSLHEHAAIQIVFAHLGDAVITDSVGVEHRGKAVIIRPLVSHALASDSEVTIIYIEPQSPLAFKVADCICDADITIMEDPNFLEFVANEPLDVWEARISRSFSDKAIQIDERLNNALALLAREPGSLRIEDAAIKVGLSHSRLRALAGQQLGLPLSTWLIWRKLESAAQALGRGLSLAEAAAFGGFADQAHFARVMRRMFGITPRTAQHIARKPL